MSKHSKKAKCTLFSVLANWPWSTATSIVVDDTCGCLLLVAYCCKTTCVVAATTRRRPRSPGDGACFGKVCRVSRTLPCFGVEKQTDSTIGEGHMLKSLLVDFRVELGQESDFGSVGVGVPLCNFCENVPDVHSRIDSHVFVDVAVGHKINVVLLEHRLHQNPQFRHLFSPIGMS